MSHRKLYKAIRAAAIQIEKEHGSRPFIVISCIGGADEHIQFYKAPWFEMPTHVIAPGSYELSVHPDSPLLDATEKE